MKKKMKNNVRGRLMDKIYMKCLNQKVEYENCLKFKNNKEYLGENICL